MTQSQTGSIVPFLRYRNAKDAIAWLGNAFGFEKQLVVPGEGDSIAHAQLTFGTSTIMLGSFVDDGLGLRHPQDVGGVTQGLYVIVDDIDTHYERAQKGGAEIVRALEKMDYGSREYTVRDCEGHLWSFGTYRPGDDG